MDVRETANPERLRRAAPPMSPGTVIVGRVRGSRAWRMRLAGEHDLSTVPLLEREAAAMLDLCTSAVVDLRGACFIDCSTVTWLLRTKQACDASGTGLRVVDGLGRFAARVLDLTACHDALNGCPPRAGSLAGAASDPAVTAAGALA